MAFSGLGSPLALGFDNTQAQWKSWTTPAPKAAPAKQAAPAPAKSAAPSPSPVAAAAPVYRAPVYRAPAVYVDPYAKWGGKAGYVAIKAIGD